MGSQKPNATYRLVGYLMVMTGSVLFGFNGNLSHILFDEGMTPITLVEFRMITCILHHLSCARTSSWA